MEKLKQNVIEVCRDYFVEKINSLKRILQEITEAANNETKSSAGDKHETARAMMQLEQEKLGKQLKDMERQFSDFEKTDFDKKSEVVVKGSLLQTDKNLFFIAASIGKLEADRKTIYVISPDSPLALALMGKKEKDNIVFNGASYLIQSVQ